MEHELPTGAKKHLKSIPEEDAREDLSQTLLKLAQSKSGAEQDMPGSESLEPVDYGEVVDEIALDYSRVFTEATGYERRNPSAVWARVLARQRQEAIEYATSNPAQAVATIERYITTLSIVSEGHVEQSIEVDLSKLIQAGLSGEIITACQNLEGQEIIEHSRDFHGNDITTARSLVATLDSARPLLELSTGRKMSGFTEGKLQLDEALEYSDYLKRIGQLDYYQACAAAGLMTDSEIATQSKEILIDRATRQALAKLPEARAPIGKNQILAEAFIAMANANPQLLDEEHFVSQFAELRNRRSVGNHYRGNDQAVNSTLDPLIVGLLALDHPELAGRLLTANQAELDALTWPAINFAQEKIGRFSQVNVQYDERGMMINHDETEADIQKLLQPAMDIVESKATQLTTYLQRSFDTLGDKINPSDRNSVIEKIMGTEDPESLVKQMFPPESIQFIDTVALTRFFSGYQSEINDKIPYSGELASFAEFQSTLALLKKLQIDHAVFARVAIGGSESSKLFRQFLPNLVEINDTLKDELSNFRYMKVSGIASGIVFDSLHHVRSPEEIRHAVTILSEQDVQEAILAQDLYFIGDLLHNNHADQILQSPNVRAMMLSTKTPEVGKGVLDSLKNRDISRLPEIEEILGKQEILNMVEQNPTLATRVMPIILYAENPMQVWEKFEELADNTFFNNLMTSSEYALLAASVIPQIVSAPNPAEACAKLEKVFMTPQPLWKTLYAYTESIIGFGPEQAHVNPNHTVSDVVKVVASLGAKPNGSYIESVRDFRPVEFSKLSVREKRAFGNEEFNALSDEEIQAIETVPFSQLNDLAKRAIYARNLFETIEQSRSTTVKQLADQRNRSLVESGAPAVESGDYLHGTTASALNGILINGNFPGESRGVESRTDSYWFFTDLSRVGPGSVEQAISGSISNYYGTGAEQVFIVYRQSDDSWQAGQESYGQSENHPLIYGGVPSTETSALVLSSPEVTLESVQLKVARNGFYIPVYSRQGELLFTPEQYDQLREDYNLGIEFGSEDIIDNSFKTGEQLGSNDGSVYFLPTTEGPKRYYIKFNDIDQDHIWTEWLGDEIYRTLGIPVPDTRMVLVEGRVGHASKWLVPEELETTDPSPLEDGFIADCLLANWDAVYNSANNTEIDGVVYRLDAGGSLDYRARGQEKTPEQWGPTVPEIQTGNDPQNLGTGMRQMYPNLTDEQIANQVTTMREQLTDTVIDSLVDSVQRPKDERDALKQTLKARRDYILQQLGTPVTA